MYIDRDVQLAVVVEKPTIIVKVSISEPVRLAGLFSDLCGCTGLGAAKENQDRIDRNFVDGALSRLKAC